MSSSRAKFIFVGSYWTEAEATLYQASLQREGIQAVIESASAATTLSIPAVGGVKLLVPQSDYPLAKAILEQDKQLSKSDSWYCTKCHEEVDAGFECCWSCGAERSVVQGEMPRHALVAEQPQANPEDISSDSPTCERVVRAWRSAIIGLLIPPIGVLLHVYSLLLVIQSVPEFSRLPGPIKRRMIGAAVIDGAVLVFLAFALNYARS